LKNKRYFFIGKTTLCFKRVVFLKKKEFFFIYNTKYIAYKIYFCSAISSKENRICFKSNRNCIWMGVGWRLHWLRHRRIDE